MKRKYFKGIGGPLSPRKGKIKKNIRLEPWLRTTILVQFLKSIHNLRTKGKMKKIICRKIENIIKYLKINTHPFLPNQ